MLASHLVGALATVFVGAAAILQILCLVFEWWIAVSSPVSSSVRIGLFRTCVGPRCDLTNYTALSICGRSGDDINTRFTTVAGLLIAGAVIAVVMLFVSATIFVKLREIFGRDGDTAAADRVCADTYVSKIALVLLGSALSGALGVAGWLLLRDTTEDFVNCGNPLCLTFTRNTTSSCDYGYSYRISISGTAIILAAALLSLLWVVLLRGNISTAVQDSTREQARLAEERAVAAAAANRVVTPPPEELEDFADVDEEGEAVTQREPFHDSKQTTSHDAILVVDDAAKPRHGGVALPEGCWEAYEGTLYWSAEIGFFYDTSSECYYDPVHEVWYSPVRDEWFLLEDDGTVVPVDPPQGGLHTNQHHGLATATPPVTTPTSHH